MCVNGAWLCLRVPKLPRVSPLQGAAASPQGALCRSVGQLLPAPRRDTRGARVRHLTLAAPQAMGQAPHVVQGDTAQSANGMEGSSHGTVPLGQLVVPAS